MFKKGERNNQKILDKTEEMMDNKKDVWDKKNNGDGLIDRKEKKQQVTGKKSITKGQQNEECIICYERFNQKIVIICEHCKNKQCKRCTQKHLNKSKESKCSLCRRDWTQEFLEQNRLKINRAQVNQTMLDVQIQQQSRIEDDINIGQQRIFGQHYVFERNDGSIYISEDKIVRWDNQQEQPVFEMQDLESDYFDRRETRNGEDQVYSQLQDELGPEYISDHIQLLLQTLTVSNC